MPVQGCMPLKALAKVNRCMLRLRADRPCLTWGAFMTQSSLKQAIKDCVHVMLFMCRAGGHQGVPGRAGPEDGGHAAAARRAPVPDAGHAPGGARPPALREGRCACCPAVAGGARAPACRRPGGRSPGSKGRHSLPWPVTAVTVAILFTTLMYDSHRQLITMLVWVL